MLVAPRAGAQGDERAAADGADPAAATLPVLAALALLGGALRFATLGTQSFWFDEAQTAHEVSLGFGALVHQLTTHETNPPLFFVLGWLWARVFGTSEVALRTISALAGTALLPLLYACGRELVSRRAGLVAAAFAAVNPFLIWYSQEAREYMLLAVLSAAALVWFARALRAPSPRALAIWGGLSALCLLTHFFAGFLVWPQAVWLLARHRRRPVLGACVALLVVQVALLPFAVSHATNSLLGFVGTTPLAARLREVPVSFAVGRLDQSGVDRYGWILAAVLLAGVIALLLAGATRRELEGAGIAGALAGCGLVLPMLAALVGEDFLISRALIAVWVPLAVVLAAACTARRAGFAGWTLAAVMLGVFVLGQVRVSSDAAYQRTDWRSVAQALGTTAGPRGIVVLDGGLATDPLRYYLRGISWRGPGPQPARVGELAVIGSPLETVAGSLPPGVAAVSDRTVAGFLIARFALRPARSLTPMQMAAAAARLLAPAAPGPAVLVERP